jgi:ribosomal protein L33
MYYLYVNHFQRATLSSKIATMTMQSKRTSKSPAKEKIMIKKYCIVESRYTMYTGNGYCDVKHKQLIIYIMVRCFLLKWIL